MIASYGEILFVLEGFLYQVRATDLRRRGWCSLSDYSVIPSTRWIRWCSLYYYAPICTILNGLAALVVEVPQMSMANIIANTLPAKHFAPSARKPKPTPLTKPPLIFPTTNQTHRPTHRQKLPPPPYPLWCPQKISSSSPPPYSSRAPRHHPPVLRLRPRPRWSRILQARWRHHQAEHRPAQALMAQVWVEESHAAASYYLRCNSAYAASACWWTGAQFYAQAEEVCEGYTWGVEIRVVKFFSPFSCEYVWIGDFRSRFCRKSGYVRN